MPRGGARLLQGGPIAAEIRQAVSEDVAAYVGRHGRRPVLAVVHYDGGQFVGWQRQPRGRTVQAEFEAALERLQGRRVPVTGAGRTDTGGVAISMTET